MARCPFAIWKPLPENATADEIDPRVAILHTAVSQALSLYPYFVRPEITVETHFYTRFDGVIEQYMDTERQADGNRDANEFSVSLENQDNAVNPIAPMTEAQLRSDIKLFSWLSDVHPKIKRQRCDRWDGSGYGYHSMWGAPSHWTPVAGKTCPGAARIKQFEEIMLPALIVPVSAQKKGLAMEAALILLKIYYDRFRGDGNGSYDVERSDRVGWAHWVNELLAAQDAGKPLKTVTDTVLWLLAVNEGKK